MAEQLKIAFDTEDLTPEEARIWRQIEGRSREEAIKIRDLAELVWMDERSMRQTIRQLRLMGYPIGSSSEPPAGYWHMQKSEDAEETGRQFLNRALKELKIYWKIRKCTLPDLMGQVELELGEDARE